ncbi:hypothetical protein [Acidomonas methanolica]|uniref:hypothetical protein n=1 Tax=Acidomonas methanolica TaxID=437 RepID=UPI00130EA8CF|nr:hypothetical protein [Acidomonas methanolica]MBU2655666.1 hypothetical protein [Acidomonas methanolica]
MKTSSHGAPRQWRCGKRRSPDHKPGAIIPRRTLRYRIEGYFVALVVTIYLKLI